jgi:hypothetical protein
MRKFPLPLLLAPLALLVVALLGACDRHPCVGTVTDKRYYPPYEYSTLTPVHVGKTSTLYIPQVHHVAPRYIVVLRYPDGQSGTWPFAPFEYEKARIGAAWPPAPAASPLEPQR